MAKKIRLTVPLDEMKEADVRYVSLVGKPANRIPFREVKSEDQEQPEGNTMLKTLKAVFGGAPAAEATPAVVAVVVRSEAAEELAPQIAELGFNIEDASEVEGHTVYRQAEFDESASLAIKANDDVAYFVSEEVAKAFAPWLDTKDFGEAHAAAGFLPSLEIANTTMLQTISNVMFDATDAAAAKSDITNVISDFGSLVEVMIDRLPSAAFKLEGVIAKGKKDKEDEETKQCPEGMRWDAATGECVAMSDEEKEKAKGKGKKDEEDCGCEPEAKAEGEEAEVDAPEVEGAEADVEAEAAKSDEAEDEIPEEIRDQDVEFEYDFESETYKSALKDVEALRAAGVKETPDNYELFHPVPPMKKAEKAEVSAAEVEQDESDVAAVSDDADATESKSDENQLSQILEAIGNVSKEVAALGQRVDEVDQRSQKAEKRFENVVLSGADARGGDKVKPEAKSTPDDVWKGSALESVVSGFARR